MLSVTESVMRPVRLAATLLTAGSSLFILAGCGSGKVSEGSEVIFPNASPYSGYSAPEPSGGLRERVTPVTGTGAETGS